MNSRYNEWLNSLTDDERDEVVILDAYFATRSPLPDKSAAGNDYVAEHKSTQEISDDLFSMMPVSCRTISKYLILKGYTPMTDTDGTLKWSIWRDMQMSGLL